MKSTRVVIAVHLPINHPTDPGRIKQVVHCHQKDADRQHRAWPGHTFTDVTGHPEKVNANRHVIGPDGKPAPRKIPIEETRARVLRQVTLKAESAAMMAAAAPDFEAARQAVLSKQKALMGKIAAATDPAVLEKITWEAP